MFHRGRDGPNRVGMRLLFLSPDGNSEKFHNWRRETGRFPSLFHSGKHAAANATTAATRMDRKQIYPAKDGEDEGFSFPFGCYGWVSCSKLKLLNLNES